MQSLAILIPLALILLALIIGLFIWAVRHDQFEDLDKSANDILFDDDLPLEQTPDTDSIGHENRNSRDSSSVKRRE